jgi:hypothetical protein
MLIIGLRTEDADVSPVHLRKWSRVVLHVLQQVKHAKTRFNNGDGDVQW